MGEPECAPDSARQGARPAAWLKRISGAAPEHPGPAGRFRDSSWSGSPRGAVLTPSMWYLERIGSPSQPLTDSTSLRSSGVPSALEELSAQRLLNRRRWRVIAA